MNDDADARALIAAMAALTQALTGDPFHRASNTAKSPDDAPPEWVTGFLDAVRQAAASSADGGQKADTFRFADEAGPTGGDRYHVLPPVETPRAEEPAGEKPRVADRITPVMIVGQQDLLSVYINGAAQGLLGGGPGQPKPKPGAKGAGESFGAGDAVKGVAGLLVRQFAAVLGPLAAFGTLLSQSGSGFGVFQTAITVLASTLAPILLPPFVLLATMLVGASDEIQQKLLPTLKKWFELVMTEGVPRVQAFIEMVSKAAEALGYFTSKSPKEIAQDAVRNPADAARKVNSIVDPFGISGAIVGGISKLPGAGLFAPWARIAARGANAEVAGSGAASPGQPGATPAAADAQKAGTAAAGKPPVPPAAAAGSAAAATQRALSDVMTSLKMSMGPKAAYSGLADVGQQMQLAALNVDPLEARVRERTLAAIDMLMASVPKIADNTNSKPDEHNRKQKGN